MNEVENKIVEKKDILLQKEKKLRCRINRLAKAIANVVYKKISSNTVANLIDGFRCLAV